MEDGSTYMAPRRLDATIAFRLPRAGRIGLLVVVAVSVLADAAITYSADGAAEPENLLNLAMFLSIAAFAWRPYAGTLLLLLGGAVGVLAGTGMHQLLLLAAVSGLVLYTCSWPLIIAYAALIACGVIAVEWAGSEVAAGGFFGIASVGVASALIGFAMRSSRRREQRLRLSVDEANRAAARAIKEERDRIADELHNLVAHDITIVVMHARALELVTDDDDRAQSIQAVKAASVQALTDIRRMLRIVRRPEDESTGGMTENEPLIELLHDVARELESVGIEVTLSAPPAIDVSGSIASTLAHLSRECVTNILKHAPDASSVEILMVQDAESVTLQVSNPLLPERPRRRVESGFGLTRMRERVRLHQGSLTVRPGNGNWTVSATLPVS